MQAQGGNTYLQRMTLHFKTPDDNHFYMFRVNPEEYTETHPQRSAAYKTRSSTVIEDYGPNTGMISFSGSTGFRHVNGSDGVGRMKQLQEDLETFSQSGISYGTNQNPNRELYFYNNTDNKYFRVALAPEGFEVSRSVSEPLLFRYKINLYILGRADAVDNRSIDGPTTGNQYRSQTSENVNPHSIESQAFDLSTKIEQGISNPNWREDGRPTGGAVGGPYATR